MENLLLGTLSYYGNKIDTKKPDNNNYNSYDGSYFNENKPEYFNQFDSLTFDNLSRPTSENVAYTTRSGFNTFLQRDLDFHNGYSQFQDSDMHYNVVPKDEFVHNNMIPSTSRRETFINLESNTRKYEQLSGNNSTWENKKEVEPFFEPIKDMNNVFGMPVKTEQFSQRYIPSFKNNYGNLPFESDIKVTTGLDGKVSAPYAVYRVMPRNIDELRSEINKKVSYETKPLETIKKGDLRAVESQITNFKLPSYREIELNDLVPNKFYVEGPKKNGEFVHTETERGITDYDYTGGAYNSNKGTAPNVNTVNFTPAKRENYLNDFTHALNAVNTRPTFTNIDSYTNYVTDRSEISQEIHATGLYNNNFASYYNNYEIAKPTMKQNNIINNNNLGINGPNEYKTYALSHDSILQKTNRETTNYVDVGNTASNFQTGPLMLMDKAKSTIKETTINNDNLLNITPSHKNTHITLSDIAKKTIRETTVNSHGISNLKSEYQNVHNILMDQAKPTIKQTTIYNNNISNTKPLYEKGIMMSSDEAKHTIKETTINNHGVSNVMPSYQNIQLHLTDNAKTTNRETIENNYISNLSSNYKKNNVIFEDEAKPTIKQTTIINSYLGNTISNVNAGILHNMNEAKPTIKHTTLYSYNGNPNYEQGSIYMQYDDEAKKTIRETTENNNHIGIMSSDNKESYVELQDPIKRTIKESTLDTTMKGQNIIANVTQSYTNNGDNAKPTIKQTLLHDSHVSMHNPNEGYYNVNDTAKVTIKQTTLLTNHKGIVKTNVNALRIEDAERNMCIDDKRQQTTLGGRLPGAKSDKIRGNINKDTLRFNDKRHTFGYVSNPGTSENYSVTPKTIKQTSKKTDLNANTFYHIDPIQIDTLNNNPLVNDIYHQKNIDFN